MKVFFCDNSFNLSSLVTTTEFYIKSISSTEKITYILESSGEVSAFSKTFKLYSLSLPFKVSTLSCGREHVGVLTEDLSVYTWGSGESGALGLSSAESSSIPCKIALSSDFCINGLVCGGWHTLILARYSAGKNFLLVTGRNSEGQLGTGKLNRELFPVKVEISEEIVEIRAGNNFSMVLSESRSVYMTGDNRFGQLGIGHKRNVFSFERVPIDNVQDIACGNHSAAVANGKVYVWGTCSFGEFLRPTLMSGISNPEQVFIGDSVGAAIDIEHNLWTWGGKNIEGKARKTEIKADTLSLNSGSHVFAVSVGKDFVRKKERSNTNSFQFNKNELLSPAAQKKRIFFAEVTSETPKYNPGYKGFRDGSSEKKEENREVQGKINFFKEENEKLLNSSQGLTSRLNEKLQENHELHENISALKELLQQKDENMKKLVQKVELMKEEKQALEENSASLKDQIRKLSIDRERLLKSFQSDSEVKTYYEKCLNELEELRHQEKARFSNELEKLQQENESIQGLLASLREENNHLRGSQELSARRLECCEDELTHASTLRSQLEEKIITLQSRLNDLTSANNNLYINLEKELSHKSDLVSLSHKSDLVSLSQLSRHLEENTGSQDQQEFQENENLANLSKKSITITRAPHLNEDNPEILTNRKGLSQQHQERLMRVAAEKLQIEDLDNELHSLSSSSPVHAIYSPIRVHKKSFEDVRNQIINLKKKRSFLHKDSKFASSSFRK